MDSILQICDTPSKNERRYCSLTCWEQKPPPVFQNDFPAVQNCHLKMTTKHVVFLSPSGKNTAPSYGI